MNLFEFFGWRRPDARKPHRDNNTQTPDYGTGGGDDGAVPFIAGHHFADAGKDDPNGDSSDWGGSDGGDGGGDGGGGGGD